MGTANQPSPQQINAAARGLVAARAVRMTQQIFSQTVVPSTQNVVNVIPRNVGLIMGFWVKVAATISNTTGGAVAITPTNFGASNVLRQIQFTDLNNNIRVQVPGWYLNFLNTIKGRTPYGHSFLNTSHDGINTTGSYGANWTVINEPASIADAGTGAVTMWYYVPLAYSDGDFRGAVYANVVNATMQLQLTINTTPVVASAGDTTLGVYTAAAGAGANTSTTITVYQDYLDQLPYGNNGPVLPILDLSTIYELKQTIFTSMTAGQDFPMQYANFRDFLSTIAVYYNGAARAAGTDINYWSLQSANFTNLWKLEPSLVALRSRALINSDLPLGCYYFGSRHRPIATTQYGNMELVINTITAGATAYALVGYEAFAMVNTITQAGSLPSS
jgi:hypothetical protein